MNYSIKTMIAMTFLAIGSQASAQYSFRVVASRLAKPTGIVVAGGGHFKTLFFTEVPTPGIGGSNGGTNAVRAINLRNGHRSTISTGEPEPINLAFANGELYWTCRSAGVILQRDRWGNISPLLTGLHQPTGIYVDRFDQTYFTQVPTPGIGGSQGGMNTVDVFTNGSIFNLTRGEPEPTDIVVDHDGTAYWTCKSAGVILRRTRLGTVSLVANNLMKPTGIALNDRCDKLYWTEVPTPGVSGSMGGQNKVRVMDLNSMAIENVHLGDPQPTDITVAKDGTIYWTCTSAGVIVEAKRH